jgi:hypothetical protein
LGYGTGAAKLRHTLKTQPPGADLSEDECKRLVDTWRESNDKIVDLWHECDKALNHLASSTSKAIAISQTIKASSLRYPLGRPTGRRSLSLVIGL